LFRGKNGAWHVFVVNGGRARDREVVIDHINDLYGELIAGLVEGEDVVLNPANDLQNGQRITARRAAP
jgi:HlyD family secretion protein